MLGITDSDHSSQTDVVYKITSQGRKESQEGHKAVLARFGHLLHGAGDGESDEAENGQKCEGKAGVIMLRFPEWFRASVAMVYAERIPSTI